ncbi:DUF418 domain-containing protein [Corynebacterium epidermidicanis]|uniref:Putative DUF418 family protein n=1 Tax=Corynebacterium epidermidicanis TaxID=1050174 RepID=A0A0G3GM43_9CORY|nr:DUF418 domain-containing protein [Corynebacterium epidermidicanis]AKK02204.1 putative DUF418 family protein [Corynebacterium epidermidicanis]
MRTQSEGNREYLPVFFALGFAILCLFWADLYPAPSQSPTQRFFSALIADGPAAVAVFAVGFLIMHLVRPYLDGDEMHTKSARAMILVYGGLIAIVALALQSIQASFVPVLLVTSAVFLFLPYLITATTSNLVWLYIGATLVSALACTFVRFNPPIGGEYPFFAFLAYAIAGVVTERLCFRSPRLFPVLFMVGVASAMAGLLTIVWSTLFAYTSANTLPSPLLRFLSPAPNTGALLNTLGNTAMGLYFVTGSFLLWRSKILRKVLQPIVAIGVSGATVYTIHICVASLMLTDLNTMSLERTDGSARPALSNHPVLTSIECLFFLVVSPVWVRIFRTGPVEYAMLRLSRMFIQDPPDILPPEIDRSISS